WWGRSWFSRPGVGIYLSLWLQPPLAPDHLPRLTLLAGLAAVRAVDAYSRGRASLKWPNDVLLNGKKMAGILCEFCETSAGDPGVILGIGINVNHSVEDFPKELRAIATSLRIENGEPVDRTGLILSLLHHLDQEYQAFLVGGEMELAAKWSEHTDMFGQRIALTRGREVLHGTALGLDAWGNLRMRTSEGREMT
ncbi:MAG: biotin--[acetyl-CoA-carboxylase] ligase, partial [Nitrospinaceae bacterium]|nr:biotin--[acetyl-CoA-carboxylase] ligase [Nitrospinaceae bacterium]NIR55523.1 biotin--[acetyl-CoA-carboxylase] ligase [Nitrospinaceae bacterium]NIS85954.1 biotin--[acetyl-CoA-carboxylase] ligase [Nitrospinaceae bacterium]NIT82803.1 biotin--[acetyl-CoA-carboxylase] ligase [Nitrospinaceae bacterium]NIU45005.1 biotin--[acetyl-CoA-carboxylase] ligase [Nitrospinaceae bacterium]